MSEWALVFGFGVVIGFALGFLVATQLHRAPVAPPRPIGREVKPAEPVQDSLLELILGKDDKLEDLRQNLRVKLLYDEAKVEQSVARERERTPQASEVELLQAAIFRWGRENR